MGKHDRTFREVLKGVNERKPSVEERVEHAKMKDQTHRTVKRLNAIGEGQRQAREAMERRDK